MKNCNYRKSDSAVQNEYVKKTLRWVEKLDFQDRRIKLSAVDRWPYLRFGRSVNTSGASNRAEPELRKPEITKMNASASVNININLVYQYSSCLGKLLIRKKDIFHIGLLQRSISADKKLDALTSDYVWCRVHSFVLSLQSSQIEKKLAKNGVEKTKRHTKTVQGSVLLNLHAD